MMFLMAHVVVFVTMNWVLCEEYVIVEFKSQNYVFANLQIEQERESHSIHRKYVVDSTNTPFKMTPFSCQVHYIRIWTELYPAMSKELYNKGNILQHIK